MVRLEPPRQDVVLSLKRFVYVVALLVIGCESGFAPSANSPAIGTPKTSPSALLVFTTWVPDPKVTDGPEPGYKPALTGLTGNDVQSASAGTDGSGNTWLVKIFFTPRGANLFAHLTRDNVAACPNDSKAARYCAQRHLGIWLELTQADIDNWEDPTYTAKVSQTYDLGCLMHLSSTTVCSKLVSDPITLEEIASGNAAIVCACTQHGANELAAAINSMRRS